MNEQKKDNYVQDKFEYLEKRYNDALKYFKHTLSVITLIFLFVGIIITILSISSKNEINDAIKEMERKFDVLSKQALKSSLIDIFSEGKRIDNRTLVIKLLNKTDFDIANIYLKNLGDGITKFISIKFYISIDLSQRHSEWWEKQTSYDINYNTLIYWGAEVPVSPGESWNLPVFKGKIENDTPKEFNCKMEVYYGGEKPVEAKFVIKLEE